MWTEEQKFAINSSGSLLLSAAAGSGKTTVLIQRITKKIINTDAKFNINELLILTFSDAVAKEIKNKILKKLQTVAREFPNNERIKKQILLLPKVEISTVHGFCKNIIKTNVDLLGITSKFSLLSEFESSNMKKSVLEKIMPKYYNNKLFIDVFATSSEKLEIEKEILNFYNFLSNQLQPVNWFRKFIKIYKKEPPFKTWEEILIREVQSVVSEITNIYEAINGFLKLVAKDDKTRKFMEEERENILDLENRIFKYNIFEINKFISFFISDVFKRFPVNRKCSDEEKIIFEKIKEKRNLCKDMLKKLISLTANKQKFYGMHLEYYRITKNLGKIVINFANEYRKYKKAKNKIDFNDLERNALKLLIKKNGPTELANNIKKKYKEILVDEYQDTNDLQDAIFKAVSREEKNMFIVGDIKQSIYSFRNSVPKLFLDKYKKGLEKQNNFNVVKLVKNFRSSENIIKFVNFIFDKIMTDNLGEIDYKKGEGLIFGQTNFKSNQEIEILLIDKSSKEQMCEEEFEEMKSDRDEAIIVAKKIIKIIEDKTLIFDFDLNQARKATYDDIALIVRSNIAYQIYKQIFKEFGIPLETHKHKMPRTIVNLMSFLEIIENPYRDTVLIGTLINLYEFDWNDIAEVRISKKGDFFYDSLKACSKSEDFSSREKSKKFLEDYKKVKKHYTLGYSITEILWQIYSLDSYKKVFSFDPENFGRLLEFSSEFKGNFLSFIKYVENECANKFSFECEESSVKWSTIHRSKGLEFPIVIFTNCGKNFNKRDLLDPFLMHKKYGIGFNYVDYNKKIFYNSISKEAIKIIKNRELLNEEMRLLYVALTRAKEKLIIVGVMNSRTMSKIKYIGENATLENLENYLINANNFITWVITPLFLHKESAKLLNEYFQIERLHQKSTNDFLLNFQIIKDLQTNVKKDVNIINKCENKKNFEANKDSTSIFNFQSEFLANKNPTNFSKIISVDRFKNFEKQKKISLIGDSFFKNFTTKNKKNSESEKGLILHFVMKNINIEMLKNGVSAKTLIDNMVKDKIITKEQCSKISNFDIDKFFASNIGQRILLSDRVKREEKVTAKFGVSELFKNLQKPALVDENKFVYLKGVVDCFFEEDSKIIIIDYKVNFIQGTSLEEYTEKNFKKQINSYAMILEKIYKKKTKERYIYYFSHDAFIKI